MKELKETILQQTENIYPQVVEWRRYLHSHPELSCHEESTSAFICGVLDDLNIPYQSNVAGFGVVAQIGHGSHAVGIRADMDALPVTEATGLEYSSLNPGVMHACGHDMHTAILLGTGALLKERESEIDTMDGAVKLFFQPAEETVGGAAPMIAAGCMENPTVERVLSLHVDPFYPLGTAVFRYGAMNAQTLGFEMTVEGKSCHGAHPDGGIDAIVMASEIVTAFQTISSRFNSPTTPVIVTVGTFNSGTAGNIVAGTAELTGTVRALSEEVMENNKRLMQQIAGGIAQAYGGKAEIRWSDDFYPALINDDAVTSLVADCAKELFGTDNVAFMPEPSLGGDDFAFFAKAAPGTYFGIGTTAPGDEAFSLHNEHYAPSEEALKTGIALESAATLKLLQGLR